MPILRLLAMVGLMLQAGIVAAAESFWPDDRLFTASAPEKTVAEPIVPRAPVEPAAPVKPIDSEKVPAGEKPLVEPKSPETVFSADEGIGASCPEPLCHVRFGPYGWLPESYGQIGIRSVTTEFGVTTRDMLNLLEHNVHFIFAAQMEIESGRWNISSSGLYIYAGFADSIRRLSFSGNSSLAIVDGVLAYELTTLSGIPLMPHETKVEVLAGGRYWLLGGSLSISGPLGNTVTRGNDVQWVDPVVGGRLTCVLNDSTRFRIRGDVGGWGWFGGADDTWNAEAVIEKRCSKYCTISGGYRILDVDYTRNSHERFVFDAQMRGPVANLIIEY